MTTRKTGTTHSEKLAQAQFCSPFTHFGNWMEKKPFA